MSILGKVKEFFIVTLVSLLLLISCKNTNDNLNNLKIVKVDKTHKVYETQELLSLYLSDLEKYDEQFKGKEIFVTGYIDDISKGGYILLHDQIDQNSIVCVPGDTLMLKYISVGDKVIFRGNCLGFLQGGSNIYIDSCLLGQ